MDNGKLCGVSCYVVCSMMAS